MNNFIKLRFKFKILGLMFLASAHFEAYATQVSMVKNRAPVVLTFLFPEGYKKDSVSIKKLPYKTFLLTHADQIQLETKKIENQIAIFTIYTESPLFIEFLGLLGPQQWPRLIEPGDEVTFQIGKTDMKFSGPSAEKFVVYEKIREQSKAFVTPRLDIFLETGSFSDFAKSNIILDRQGAIVDSILEASRSRLSKLSYDYIYTEKISEIELNRLSLFSILTRKAIELNISQKKLEEIFDSIETKSNFQRLLYYKGIAHQYFFYYLYIRLGYQRQLNFNFSNEKLENVERKIAYMEKGKKIFRGTTLQDFMAWLLTDSGLKDHVYKEGGSPEIEGLLKNYYYYDADPDYAAYVKRYEDAIREWCTHADKVAPDFIFQDTNGKQILKKDFLSKIVILSFYGEDEESQQLFRSVSAVANQYKGNNRVAFLNVFPSRATMTAFADKVKDTFINLNVYNLLLPTLLGADVLKQWNVKAYSELNLEQFPRAFLINEYGKLVFYGDVSRQYRTDSPSLVQNIKNVVLAPFPYPNRDEGKALRESIDREIAFSVDGPYVIEENGSKVTFNIDGNKVLKSNAKQILIPTDVYSKKFHTILQRSLKTPKAEISKPLNLFALSDIEGNFHKFRLLLQSNRIIDTAFNWTFGTGHLVFSGDMFDRGKQVTECLWLIYSLEEKARAAGGQVHFILGNHEIMNLQGDHRYVDAKYDRSAKLIGKTLTQLYGEASELGRWLRTKNLVEKIGDLLFAHGGISPELNESNIEISEINNLARPNYAIRKDDYLDGKTNLVMSPTYGPFWYRGYYPDEPNSAVETMIDSVLNTYKVKHIVTGHTIIADTVSVLYHNKVINTDTRHAKGKSEALMIEGNSYYRVNDKGQRWLLFKDEEDVKSPPAQKNNK